MNRFRKSLLKKTLVKTSGLWLSSLALAAGQASASEGSMIESAYDRAVKAYHSKDWVEQPDELLIRSSRIKWNRLAKAALGLPDWVEFSLRQRTRIEQVTNNWRQGQSNTNNTQLPLQSRVRLGINQGPVWLLFEGQDSRTHFNEIGDFKRRMINTFDILQMFGSLTFKNVFDTGLRSDFHLGRFTLELGNARLIGRNNFPNTTNTFDGGHFSLGNDKDWRVRAFLTAPVILDQSELDESSDKQLFWGVAFESKQLEWLSGEAYYLGLSDSIDDRPDRGRHFSTLGFHAYRKEAQKPSDFGASEFGRVFYDVEPAIQTGTRRGKDHFAWMSFANLGYSFNLPWTPRLRAEYVYASGTRNPDGDDSQTFDRLFGLRRPDLMQTSLFGPFSHSNLQMVGWNLDVNPLKPLKFTLRNHYFWLAERKDALSGSRLSGFGNLQDRTGQAGRRLGQTIELIGQYKIGTNIDLNAGYSHWFKGRFFDRLAALPNRGGLPVNGEKDTDYVFGQVTFQF